MCTQKLRESSSGKSTFSGDVECRAGKSTGGGKLRGEKKGEKELGLPCTTGDCQL